jgi:PAS domain S-box-containing protein
MDKLRKLLGKRAHLADSMVVVGIFLAFLYWGLEAFLNVFSPEEVNFYRQIFGPNVSETWMRLIVLCLFLIFGSHVQYTINKRKEVEQALKESEEKYRTILESMEEGYYEVDFDGNFTFANDSMSSILGYPKKDLPAINYRQFMDDKNVQIVEDTFNRCRQSGSPVKAFDCEFNRNEMVLFIEASVSLLNDGRDEPNGYHGIIRDRTEKKKLEMDLIESYKKLQNARAATILGLAKLAEYRDEGTGTHLERIREYAKRLAEEMAQISRYHTIITPEYIEDIFQSSILHDIGKVGIPDAILLKPGRLNDEEFEVIKRHATMGGDAIAIIESRIEESTFLFMGKEIAYGHHEKWDGSGYPKGLKGEQIPLSARIVALADVYDALTTKRFYKEAYTHEKSKKIITDLKGSHFDPETVDAFLVLETRELIDQPAQAVQV